MNNPPPNRELWIRGVPFPEVHVYRPARPDGSSLLVLPGGGYEFLSIQNEGFDPADRFNAERTTCFILTYRLPVEGWSNRSQVALQDAHRAMRLIRSRAADFRIDPARLGALGFSAGGHLAADLAVSHAERVYAPVDLADELSARPAFVGLVYPVISLDPKETNGTSGPNLLGPNPPAELVAARSPALHVTKDTPPSFIAAAMDDGLVLPPNSLHWINACLAAKGSVEAHLFADGGHGFGLHLPKDLPGSRWPDLFALWMRRHGG
jgi:acetyl esterase/lipase